jgi:hypothetical protein
VSAARHAALHGEDATPDVLDLLVERIVRSELVLQLNELVGVLGEGDKNSPPRSVFRARDRCRR